MFSENILDGNVDVFEGMTSISAVINSILSCGSERRIIKIFYDRSRLQKKSREISYLTAMSGKLSFELVESNAEYLDSITSGTTHGGFVALCTKRNLTSLDDERIACKSGAFYALLEGIEDPYNFGYSVRSLYAAGADGIILPHRNWLEFSSTVARSSAGTSELANIFVSDTVEAVKAFKNKGFNIVCAGIRDSVSVYEADFMKPTLLIVGGEKRGISRKLLDMCDQTVRIDYGCEFMGSLPTASAVSVIAFEALRQRKFNV